MNPLSRECRYFLLPLLVLLCLALSGCATMNALDERVSVSLGEPITIHREQWVRRSQPVVHVHPNERASASPTVLFVPFRVTQPITQPDMVGYAEARIVWQTWLSMQLFPAMEFAGDHGPYRRDTAMALARGKGADVLIGGFVTYYYSGGSAGDSRLALQVELYDVSSGQLIWSMAHGGAMPAAMMNDYVVFATKTRLPADPMYAITQALAQDMGAALRKWLPGQAEPEDSPLQRMDKSLERKIRGEPSTPMPEQAPFMGGRPAF